MKLGRVVGGLQMFYNVRRTIGGTVIYHQHVKMVWLINYCTNDGFDIFTFVVRRYNNNRSVQSVYNLKGEVQVRLNAGDGINAACVPTTLKGSLDKNAHHALGQYFGHKTHG